MDYSQITSQIWVGSAIESVADVAYMIGGINPTRIINCRAEFDDQPLLDQESYAGLYLWDGIPDWLPWAAVGLEPIPDSFFKAGLDFWVPSSKISTEKLYVHCSSGLNRSVVLAYAILLAQGMSRVDAIVTLNAQRPITLLADFIDHPWRKNAEHAVVRLGYPVR